MPKFITELHHMLTKRTLLTKKESSDLLIAVLITTVILAINDGTTSTTITYYWFAHLAVALLASYIALTINIVSSKIYAGFKGFKSQFTINYIGLFGGLILSIMLNGLPIFAFGGSKSLIDKKRNITRQNPTALTSEMATSAILAALSNLILGTVLIVIARLISNSLIEFAGIVNLLFAVYSLLPVPMYTNAFPLMFHSRTWYVTVLGGIITYSIIITKASVASSILFSILGATLVGYWYFKSYEK